MILRDILRTKGSSVHSIHPSATLAEVVNRLVEHNCGSLVVCENEQMVGIITERDILRACAFNGGTLAEKLVRDSMTTNVTIGSPDDSIGDTMGLMTDRRIRHLPILEEGKLAGLISIGDVVKSQHDNLEVENHLLKNYIQS
ncbi:MAG: CBS domain-containing protein [Pirellulaceae bacterium]